jgi:hypothetical protein
MLHLARSRSALKGIKDLKDVPDPGPTRVAVLPCADLTPGNPRKIKGGPAIQTLWGELAFRLGEGEAYERLRVIDQRMTAPGNEDLEQLLNASKRRTLILADEVLIYVEKAMTVPVGDSTLGRQTLTFLQGLTETVAGDPNSAFVYSLQASVAEAVGDEGLLQTLDKLVGRVDARRVPVRDQEVKEIIRRRLFKSLGDESIRRLVAEAYAEEYRRFAIAAADTASDKSRVEDEVRQLREEVVASYPFHPGLIRLMYERWGSLPSYQRTRGALQFLATVVHILFKRGHGGALIAPGDIPLDDPDVRAEFFRQVGEREKWDSVLDADIAGKHARSKSVDRRIGESSPALSQARVGSSTATAVALYSFGARKDEMRGVTQGELLASCVRPGVEPPVIQSALAELRETLLYLHSNSGRLRMDTIPSLTKLIEESIAAVDADDVVRKVKDALEALLRHATTAVIWPEHPGRVPDERREFLIAYLPLEWAERDQAECESNARDIVTTRSGSDRGGNRKFRNGVGLAVPLKSHADQARAFARRVLALEGLRRRAKGGQEQVSAEQLDELEEKHRNALKDLEGACRGLYGQVLLPVRGKEADAPIAFRRVELGSLAAVGGDLHGRIRELLKKQVFDWIDADRFLELIGISDKADGAPFVSLTEALDGFFRFVDRPKMVSDSPLLSALAEAVAGRKVGFLPSAHVDGSSLVPADGVKVRFGTHHGADEFAGEEGAYILSGALAKSLAVAQANISPKDTDERKPIGARDSSGGQIPLIEVAPVPKGQRATRFVLNAKADKKTYLKLSHAMAQLFSLSDSMTVTVAMDASQPAGFDPVKLRNTVQEPLTEAGIEHKTAAGTESGQ